MIDLDAPRFRRLTLRSATGFSQREKHHQAGTSLPI